ncbi:acyltransferase [Dyella sp. M7H15-1]|uniref:acyltransferase family protein n=1 Tax=Dyella sp. M7H15-1 TaxID=2501295 RepID=UPI001004E788|nr:acyltransferase [Dyella sp. M7H15-1]QAU23396.1 acyltransferase [Dyella sp. M7H15-1]
MQKNRKGSHIAALDGLRGYAALAVTMYHGILHFDTSLIDRVLYQPVANVHGVDDLVCKVLLALFNGESAVILFFVLSGYVLASSIDRSLDAGRKCLIVSVEFLVKRAWRIYPAMFACMVFYWVLSRLLDGRIGYATINAVIFWSSVTLYRVSVHGPSWSLQVEMLAAPFILAFALMRRYLGFFSLVLVMAYAMFSIEYPVLIGNANNLWPYLIAFVIGIVVASPEFGAIRFEPKPAHIVIALITFIFFRQIVSRNAISGLIAHSLLAGLLVFAVSRSHTGRIHQFLNSRISQFFGRISYSFYLLNVPVLLLVWGTISAVFPHPEQHYLGWGIVSGVIATVLTMPFAWACERYIERPSMHLIRSVLAVAPKQGGVSARVA